MSAHYSPSSQRLQSDADVAAGLAALLKLDPRLQAVAEKADPVTLRQVEPTLWGLIKIVIAQQVSTASAQAIQTRFAAAFPDITASLLANTEIDQIRAAGLSLPKAKTVVAIAQAVRDGLDLASVGDLPADEAMAQLTAIKGVGPWTAEIFLLFGCGHRDILPAGDLALQVALSDALCLPYRLSTQELREIGIAWMPWRGVAAKLLWAYHHVRSREAPTALRLPAKVK